MGDKMSDILKFDGSAERSCLICGDRQPGHLQRMSINRTKNGDNVATFTICDECLAHMGSEIVKYVN